MDAVSVRWNGKRQMVGWDEAGHGVVMDSRPAYGGEGTGARPLQVFLYALAGCSAMDVISILEKKRQDVRDLEVAVEAEQREDEFPKIYTRIKMTYIVTGFAVSEEAVKRAIELSEEKYCSVRGMLGPQVVLTTAFEIRNSLEPGVSVREG